MTSALGEEDGEPPSRATSLQQILPKISARPNLQTFEQLVERTFFRSAKRPLRRSLLSVLETLPGEAPQRALNEVERGIVENLLQHRARAVEDHMVPRSEIFAIPISASREEALTAMRGAGHSRAPVYEDSLDNTKGYLHLKDLIGLGEADGTGASQKPILESLRSVIFASPAISNLDLLRQMRLRRTHLALIVDEHGGVDGLVTIEDLIEEFFGEIEDEHDKEVPQAVPKAQGDGSFPVEARLRLENLPPPIYQALRKDAEEEDIDTIGGFVSWLAGRVPRIGDRLTHQPSGWRFLIVAANTRRVTRLSIAPPK